MSAGKLRACWRTVHQWIGLSLGAVLALIGLSGALLAFRAELLTVANPGVVQVAARAQPLLTPAGLLAALPPQLAGRPIAALTLFAEPGAAAHLVLAGRPQQPGEDRSFYLDPYTGAVHALRGQQAMETVESFHRWLLLPKPTGRWLTGTLALLMALMVLTGLLVRAPRLGAGWRSWRGMYRLHWSKQGRPFWWSLHSAVGVWLLPVFLVSGATGLYWAFDAVGHNVDRALGVRKPPREARKPAPIDAQTAHELDQAWASFARAAPDWQSATLRPTRLDGHPVQISWIARNALHERQRNLMQIVPGDDRPALDQRHAALPAGERAVRWVYPLHMGSWAGVPGRLAMLAGGLAMALFAVTGWVLYLQRLPARAAVPRVG